MTRLESAPIDGAPRRRRRAVGVVVAVILGATAVLAVVLGAHAGGPTPAGDGCAATPLALPAGLDGLVAADYLDHLRIEDVDATGRFILASYNVGTASAQLAIVWDRGNPTLIRLDDPLVEYDLFQPVAINAHGTIVGTGNETPRFLEGLGFVDRIGWVYRDGVRTKLAMPSGRDHAEATGHQRSRRHRGQRVDGERTAGRRGVARERPAVGTGSGRAGERGRARHRGGRHRRGLRRQPAAAEPGRPHRPAGQAVRVGPRRQRPFLPMPSGQESGYVTQVRGVWAVRRTWQRDGRHAMAAINDGATEQWNLRTGEITRWAAGPVEVYPATNARGDLLSSRARLYRDTGTVTLSRLPTDLADQSEAPTPVP